MLKTIQKAVLLTVVLDCASLLAAQPVSAIDSASAPGGCGKPAIHVWYDADPFGRWMKVKFSSPEGCVGGPLTVASITAQVYCTDTRRKVYDHQAVARPPVETEIETLPGEDRCRNLYADATIRYTALTGEPSEATDQWRWQWGNYPA
ncbi:hypothetical protein AB0G05_45155 [Nonomuraea wenchangensis]